MVTNYTVIAIIAIVAIAIVVPCVVAIVGIFVYKYEELKIDTKAKVNADLQNGSVDAEISVGIESNSKLKSKRK